MRKLQDLTAQQAAERAGMSRDTLRRLEHGEVGVSLETVLSVARALGALDRLVEALDPWETDLCRARACASLPQRVRRGRPLLLTSGGRRRPGDSTSRARPPGWYSVEARRMNDLEVRRWQRYGHDRLYVQRPDGERLDYWDSVPDQVRERLETDMGQRIDEWRLTNPQRLRELLESLGDRDVEFVQ